VAEGRVRRIPVNDDEGNLSATAMLDDMVETTGGLLKDAATVIE